ncbi:glycoside hydrolase family protein [Cryptosporangium sp. NPDC051539]|uniref:glycoside hydrolase family protein n=1 Tax=Cryptosporangium sp. NPDC051539 TaxID=3363962 RepID=UPI00379E88B8
MSPSHRRPRRHSRLILAVCAGFALVALSVGGWLVGSGPDGDLAAVADARPAPSSGTASARPRVSLGPKQAGAGASRSPHASATHGATHSVSSKKGAALNPFGAIRSSLADSGVSWYYDWDASPQGISAPPGVHFVPMIWGTKSMNDETLAAVKQRGDTLLGFNEPDFESQSNMSPSEALDLWPRLEATGMRLGSPAPAFGAADDGSWFDQFMKGAKSRGYRVDFIALHWYGGDFETENAVEQLQRYLQRTWDRWHKPIWLTEYALINFGNGAEVASPEQQSAFVTASTKMMDGLSFVERYSWFKFSPPKEGGQAGTTLYNEDGSRTTMGDAYRAAG